MIQPSSARIVAQSSRDVYDYPGTFAEALAPHAARFGLRRPTPYSLRRGITSLRIRGGEDRQAIAKQCGTSVEMLERSYSFAIEDLEDEGPQPAEEKRLRARQLALAGRHRQLRVG